MTSIGFLHTSPTHVATFDALVDEVAPGTEVINVVDEYLLDRARSHGLDDLLLIGGIADRLAQLVDVDVAVCTCSTIGATAERIGRAAGVAVVRVDRPVAELAVAGGGHIAAVATVESTLGPTAELFVEVADLLGRRSRIDVHLVDGAWERFEAGDLDGYLQAIVDALPAIATTADVIVLAQVSMAPAAAMVGDLGVPVLSSPRAAVESLLG